MISLFQKKNQELEHLLERIRTNVSNNYKDAAQEYFREYETRFQELSDDGVLNEKQKALYGGQLNELKESMKQFSHKDQKPYWT